MSDIESSSDYSDVEVVVKDYSDESDACNDNLDIKPIESNQNAKSDESSSDDDDMDTLPTMDNVNESSDEDDDTVEIDTNKKDTKDKTKNKNSNKPARPKTQINSIPISNIIKDVNIPTKTEFINSHAFRVISWMLEHIHRKNITSKEGKQIKDFGSKLNKKDLETFYDKFAKVYPYKKSLRDLLSNKINSPSYISNGKIDDNNKHCIIVKYKKDKNGKQNVYYCSETEMTMIKDFDKFVNDLYANINKNSLSIYNMYEFLQFDIWKTNSIYEYKDVIKTELLDFPQFGINYDDEFEYRQKESKSNIEDYIGLFNSKIIKDPHEVFKRRAGIISGNEHLFTDESIKTMFNMCLKRIKADNKTEVDKILSYILADNRFRNIFIKVYTPNKFIDRCLNTLFKHKDFKNIVSSKLYDISFLFGPYMFKNQEISDDYEKRNKSEILKKATTNSRKEFIIKKFILNKQDNCNKENNYWLGFINTPKYENYWFKLTDEEINKEKEYEAEPEPEKQKKQKESSASRHSTKRKGKN